MPSDQKVKTEILYNKYDVFRNLFWMFMLAGLVTLLFVILKIFYNNKFINSLVLIGKIAIILLFIIHTAGLIARWYISGHAPWSDAYESMIYVAWATMFFGLAFGRKSDLTLASTAFVASMILMIAHWNWMDPAIANLVPVLDSYWLMIHVAVIVGSYGPFTLGMILGVVSLLLMIFTNSNNKAKMKLNIREITIITEMALTVGLVMLTIGNFLGGQWANESWGRYWGWDPKETWALISIMVYAFVIHMRLVPGLRGRWFFNFMSIVAFASIMMTYFGVNFYLSGLHSYASGDKVITPDFIYYSIAVVVILGALSYWKYKKHYYKGDYNN
jgi:cytochrome c-type biogenesis protein CcsB